MARARADARPEKPKRNRAFLFIRNALLWLIPVAAVWAVLTPAYNRFLLGSAENLAHIGEGPNVTQLLRKDQHFAYVGRRDFPPAKSLVHSFRVTDVHFHLVMIGALFLAVPGVPWRERLANLGWAVLITIFYDIFLVFLYTRFAYATQLGPWSLAHYGPFARNFWGLSKHLFDLPFKLALPFLLWVGFYLRFVSEEIRIARA